MPIFKPFATGKPGLIYDMLCKSYQELETVESQLVADWKKSWKRYDDEIFKFPDTVGASGFLTIVENQIVGFASFDPRQLPHLGTIGHNCILPEFRNRGYGKTQLLEMVRLFREKDCQNIEASTGDHTFFRPALRMYKSCGFFERRREADATMPFDRIILLFEL